MITQTQPIAVIFTLPETQLPDVREQMHGGQTLSVAAYDRANTKRIATGVLETLDNQIDVSTGTVKLKARFDNADDALFPNQFVNVRLHVETRKGVTVIPNNAVQRGSQGPFVFVAEPDNTVAVRQLKLGPVSGDMVAVNEGIKPGDRVVIEGTDRLRTGAKVDVVTDATTIPATPGAALGAEPGASTAAPARYADIVCERARIYLSHLFDPESVKDSESVSTGAPGGSSEGGLPQIRLHPNIRDTMFYV